MASCAPWVPQARCANQVSAAKPDGGVGQEPLDVRPRPGGRAADRIKATRQRAAFSGKKMAKFSRTLPPLPRARLPRDGPPRASRATERRPARTAAGNAARSSRRGGYGRAPGRDPRRPYRPTLRLSSGRSIARRASRRRGERRRGCDHRSSPSRTLRRWRARARCARPGHAGACRSRRRRTPQALFSLAMITFDQ